ncbi:MAG: DUF3179 domain-containing protein [Chloroflexi bacterium]|nr:DUF3179 domain-containing protein [Chloroflexota bacterium]
MDGRTLTFDVFGLLQGVLTMRDRQTGSVWTHLDGKAISGPLQGVRLRMVPMPQMSWGEWKALHPKTVVLSPDTLFQDRYRPVRIGVFNRQEAQFGDARLPANTLVVGVEVEGQFKAYPLAELQRAGGVVNDTLAGRPIVALYDPGANSGLAYSRQLDGATLDFSNASAEGFLPQDKQTGSTWDRQGRGTTGPLAGKALAFVPSFISEWYGWSGYHPQTTIFYAPSAP